jgi:hypothetical protein
LRYISASKSIGEIEGVHDRLERLRNEDFRLYRLVSSMKTLLAQAANSSPIVQRAVETVTIGDYPSGNPAITYTRATDGTVTCAPATVDFSNTNLVVVDVSSQWQSTFAGRTRIARTSSIVSAGSKK